MPNFNFVAPFYDGLVRLVFGKKLWRIQQTHLAQIQEDQKVLVIGGGTGRILEWLPDCDITYLELSSKMIERARTRRRVRFVHEDLLTWRTDEKFDWIICPFFLDCFSAEDLKKSLDKLHPILGNGKLMVIDFSPAKNFRQVILLKLMHHFFRLIAKLQSRKLQDLNEAILTSGFHATAMINRDGVFSAVYTQQD